LAVQIDIALAGKLVPQAAGRFTEQRMTGKSNDHLIGSERDHLAQKCCLVRDIIEDAHGDADVEGILEVKLEEVGLDELAPVGNLVLLRLLSGQL
jgi:hypothetical protein